MALRPTAVIATGFLAFLTVDRLSVLVTLEVTGVAMVMWFVVTTRFFAMMASVLLKLRTVPIRSISVVHVRGWNSAMGLIWHRLPVRLGAGLSTTL